MRFKSPNNFILILVFFLFCSLAPAPVKKGKQEVPERPNLVIGIIVDQMRYDFLFRYWDKFGKDGFKRLVNEGYLCKNTHFNFIPTYTAPGHASIFTGTTPSTHGIIANEWYDRGQDSTFNCVADKGFATIGSFNTNGERSPRKLLTTTIADELRLSNNMQSRSIGISLKDRSAILSIGQTGTAAYWYDATSGRWISSSYYLKDLPDWVKKFNEKKLPATYLSQPWKTLLPIAAYTESTEDDVPFEQPFNGEDKAVFPHNLPKLKDNEKDLLQKTPFGNTFTKDFAKEAIKAEKLGNDKHPDFLTVSFSATDYIGHQFGPNSIEMEDTYIRLDKDIADFLKFIDAYLLKSNVLIFLTADHGASLSVSQMDSLKIPSGNFNESATRQELEAYFEKQYGKDKSKQKTSWVLSFNNLQVFLNYDLAVKKKIEPEELQKKAAEFLQNRHGVAKVYTAAELQKNEYRLWPGNMVKNGFHAKRSGDLAIVLEPGWMDQKSKQGTTHGSGYSYDTHVPLIWYGWKIQKGTTGLPVEITEIAPTIAEFMNISKPNGCNGKSIEGLIK